MAQGTEGEYLREFRRIGNAVKVSAIDPITAQEVSIVGPADIGQEELSRVAIRKLKYVMRKKTLPKLKSAKTIAVEKLAITFIGRCQSYRLSSETQWQPTNRHD